MAPSGVVAHWQSRPALEPIRAQSPSIGAADDVRDDGTDVLGLWFLVPKESD